MLLRRILSRHRAKIIFAYYPSDHERVSHSVVSDSFGPPWTVAHHALQSMEFSRHEYESGVPFHSPGVFPTERVNVGVLHCRQILYYLSHQVSPLSNYKCPQKYNGKKRVSNAIGIRIGT